LLGLVVHTLLVNSMCAEEILEFCDCCGKFMWHYTPPEDWEVT
jgi:hypothetical protein